MTQQDEWVLRNLDALESMESKLVDLEDEHEQVYLMGDSPERLEHLKKYIEVLTARIEDCKAKYPYCKDFVKRYGVTLHDFLNKHLDDPIGLDTQIIEVDRQQIDYLGEWRETAILDLGKRSPLAQHQSPVAPQRKIITQRIHKFQRLATKGMSMRLFISRDVVRDRLLVASVVYPEK